MKRIRWRTVLLVAVVMVLVVAQYVFQVVHLPSPWDKLLPGLVLAVITAIGLTNKIWIIITAVIVSFAAILAFARPIGEFIIKHPALKILALSFLITIGVTIFMEGLHKHVPKAYIYLPMGFAIFVEMLQMRYEHNRRVRLGEG